MSNFHAYHNQDKQGQFDANDFYTSKETKVGDLLYVVIGKKNKSTRKTDYFLSGKYLIKNVLPNNSTGPLSNKKWHLVIDASIKLENPVLLSKQAGFDVKKYNDNIIFTGGFKKQNETTLEFFELFDAILESAKAVVEDDAIAHDLKNSEAKPTNSPDVSASDLKDLESATANLSTSEREAVIKVRFGQGAFRSSLLEIAGEACWMSGIEGKELLIASHIQPWAHSEKNPEARGCPNNGLLLSSLWDAAFDAGLVTFDEDWRVVSSPLLSESAEKHLGLHEEKFLPECFRNPLLPAMNFRRKLVSANGGVNWWRG